MIRINLNTVVFFQLTTTGYNRLKSYYASLALDAGPPKEEYRMPLWEVMHIFGPDSYMGVPESPIVGMTVEVR